MAEYVIPGAEERVRLTWLGYAGVAVAAATLARLTLDPLFGGSFPYTTYFVAAAVASGFGRTRTAALTLVGGGLLAAYLFAPPRYSFATFADPNVLLGLAVYLVVGGVVVLMSHAMRAARRRVEALLAVAVAAEAEAGRAGRAEAEQGERLRTTLASIGDAVITTDTDGRVTNLNPVAMALTGWANAEAIGRPLEVVFRIVNETTRRQVENPIVKALREGVIVGLANHTVLIAKDGTERPIDDSAAPIRCQAGEVVGCVLVFRDITERRRAEAEREKAQVQVAVTLESITDGFMRFDRDWRVVYVNAEAERLGRRPRADILGKTLWELYPASVGTPLEAEYRRAVAERVTVEFENYYEPWGRWFAVKGFPASDGGLAVYYRDVTAQKKAEERLRASEERFRTLFDTMDEGFVVIEVEFDHAGGATDYRHVEANPAFEKHTGLRGHLGRSVRQTVPGLEEFWFATYGRVAATGEPTRFEHQAGPLDGRWFDVYASRLGGPGSNRVAVLFTDVTARKVAEVERERLVGQLRDADRRKDEFLATLAHELRNPLAPIRTGLQLLAMADGDTAAAAKARTIMDRQLGQMVRLVDDLMDVSRISRGKLELKRERVPLVAVIGSAVEASRPLIDQMGHHLTVALPDEPITLDADLTRLAQVVMNLLNNAAKYSDRGSDIALTAERRDGEMVVAVKDTGIGIPRDKLTDIFEMFAQVDHAAGKSQGGLGIGLALVKRLAGMHGGTVEARSDGPGKGSEFVVRLPVVVEMPVPHVAEPVEGSAPRSALRILVVDDNDDGANSLSEVLRLMGNEVATAYDGQEGLAVAGAFRPDVLVTDIGMPKMDGVELARRVREQPWGEAVTVIALTGWGQDEDVRRTREAGIDRHLVKPVDPASLMRLLAETGKVRV